MGPWTNSPYNSSPAPLSQMKMLMTVRSATGPPARTAMCAPVVAGIGGQEPEDRAGADAHQLEDGPERRREQQRAEPGQGGRRAHALLGQVVAAEYGLAGDHQHDSDGEYRPRDHYSPDATAVTTTASRRRQERRHEQRQRKIAPGH